MATKSVLAEAIPMTALEQKWAAVEATDPNIIPPMTDPSWEEWRKENAKKD